MTHLNAEQRKAVESLSEIPVEELIAGMRQTIADLRAENAELRRVLEDVKWLIGRALGRPECGEGA